MPFLLLMFQILSYQIECYSVMDTNTETILVVWQYLHTH